MPSFSAKSKAILATCHPDIQAVMNLAITRADFTVLYGERSEEEQLKLYKIGRKLVKGVWTIIGKVVTNLDGKIKKSKHNHSPSLAVDIAPYPIDWNDIPRFKKLAVIVKQCADELGIAITWGGDWKKFIDYPHYEIKE